MPLLSPCHFFQALATLACLEEYLIRTAWSWDIYFFWIASLCVLRAILAGSETSETYLTSSLKTYSLVVPGQP